MPRLPMLGDRVACEDRGGALLVMDVACPWPHGETHYRCETATGESVALVSGDFLLGGSCETPCRVEES